ncbi:MAG TPA: c-type cytochrome [Egibacteraceae bacterium]|nr:c-type cytochrome [Egibacteraceae bacterium]
MRRDLLAWLVVGLVVLGACGGGQEVSPSGVQVPGDPELGRDAIAAYGCTACHAVPGVPGNHTEVGPPLAGLAQRRVIAGRLPNTPENVAAWVRRPQEIDPGNVMPDLDVTPEDAEHIAAYLYTLR